MQPVTITNLDRLLTALIQAKQRGDWSKPLLTVCQSNPAMPIFSASGQTTVKSSRSFASALINLCLPIMLPYSSVMGFSLLLSILSKCHE